MQNKELVISMSMAGGHTLEEIARECGYTNLLSVRQVLRNAGIRQFPKTENRVHKDQRNAQIIDLRKKGYSHKDIAETIGVNVSIVSAVLRKAGMIGEKFDSKSLSDRETRICKECGKSFEWRSANQLFCSHECQKRYSHRINDPIRRARKRNAVIDTNVTLEKLYDRESGICYLCGNPTDWNDWKIIKGKRQAGKRYPTIDHVIPISKGGEHIWSNVRLACLSCNASKGTRHVG